MPFAAPLLFHDTEQNAVRASPVRAEQNHQTPVKAKRRSGASRTAIGSCPFADLIVHVGRLTRTPHHAGVAARDSLRRSAYQSSPHCRGPRSRCSGSNHA